jgi:Ca2+-binding EF-hand superfamily protein
MLCFQDFVVGLSILIRGSLEEKLRWVFTLYDQDRDGLISREEMEDVVGSVFDLMGRTGETAQEEEIISERVDRIFEVSQQ